MKKSKQKLLKFSGLSNEVFELIRFELNMFLLRFNNKFNPGKISKIKKFTNSDNILLNIGAGPFGEVEWVNIDMFMYKNISFTYDCRKKLPFRNESVSVIRAEHVLEHMDIEYEAIYFLKECLRVLKPGGTMRIVVPDIEKYVKAYYENNWEVVGLSNPLPDQAPAKILSHTFRQDGEHKFGYDYKALQYLLKEAGFKTVNKTEYGVSADPQLTRDQPNHKPYSLYVEAIKHL